MEDINLGLKGGVKGYQDVRDNAPMGIRLGLRGVLTVTEVLGTAGLSGYKYIAYELVSGSVFDSFSTSKYALTGYYAKTYIDKSLGTDAVNLQDINPYKF